ncbi:putative 3-hydroxyisobutyrate dehydrogenase protein [Colletotrichum scovillei]|uniref:putative 3-hydroxyisobutyrate dehydrogenase protein n=1 Tax=Colletotrichum scovillei TaxID=1209932 RepID=UPI0015C36549|nr:putative 3-hydroxyisobutyrate dehydrogenase protein [Colletotrichum scovillei]KAF4772784.1 putative 3-hydroxyisobutyrate dehydrogenase protein [Colletotrichum scovillei]
MVRGELPSIGFIGLGAMGFGMATNLVREGYKVKGFDISDEILKQFVAAGGTAVTSPAEAARDQHVCICMVATPLQAQTVLLDGKDPAVPALPIGAVLLLCSTVPCGYVQNLSEQIANCDRADIALIDCPVSGGAIRAANGSLSIMAGASKEAIGKGQDVLQAMSDPAKLYIVDGGIGAGSNMKMCHQVLASNQILAASEAMGLASRLGLSLETTGKHIITSDAWSWMFENRLPRILNPIITSEARRAGFPCHMTSIAEQVYFTGLGRGWGSDDDSTLIRLYTEGKGGVGPVKAEAESDDAKLKLVVDLLRGIHLCAAAETLAFAEFLGLNLHQVHELCVNAAGGSRLLTKFGPEMVQCLRPGTKVQHEAATAAEQQGGLGELLRDVENAVEEAQRLKVPVFLATQALNLLRRAARAGRGKTLSGVTAGALVRVWEP